MINCFRNLPIIKYQANQAQHTDSNFNIQLSTFEMQTPQQRGKALPQDTQHTNDRSPLGCVPACGRPESRLPRVTRTMTRTGLLHSTRSPSKHWSSPRTSLSSTSPPWLTKRLVTERWVVSSCRVRSVPLQAHNFRRSHRAVECEEETRRQKSKALLTRQISACTAASSQWSAALTDRDTMPSPRNFSFFLYRVCTTRAECV